MQKSLNEVKQGINRREKKRRVYFLLKLVFYLGLLFAVASINAWIDEFLGSSELTGKIINALFFYLTGHLIIALTRMVIVGVYLRKNKVQMTERSNFVVGINQMSSVISFIIFFVSALSVFDISMAQLFTSISIVAAALAILTKDYISNMINGLILMFTNQLSLNDIVKIGANRGRIVDITLMNIHLINDDEELVLIPNNTILNIDVINYTKQTIPKVVYEFDLSIDYISHIDRIKSYLVDHLKEYADHIQVDSYALKVLTIMKDTLHLKFQVIVKKDNDQLEKQIRKAIPHYITQYLANHKT